MRDDKSAGLPMCMLRLLSLLKELNGLETVKMEVPRDDRIGNELSDQLCGDMSEMVRGVVNARVKAYVWDHVPIANG